MKKSLIFFLGIMCMKIVHAQTNLEINANIKGLEAGKWVYWQKMTEDKKDSVQSTQNGFKIKTLIQEGAGNIYFIRTGGAREEGSSMYLYLDKGIVNINSDGPLFKNAKLSGSSFVQEWNDYNNTLKKNAVVGKADTVYKQYNEAFTKKDTVTMNALRPLLNEIDSIRTLLSKGWVESHRSSPISAFVLYVTLRRTMPIEKLESEIDKLHSTAQNNGLVKIMRTSIDAQKLTAIGKMAPDFSQNDTSGKAVALKDYRGKYVLVDFWASWCVPCRKENPNVVEAFKKFKDKGFTIVGVSLDYPGKKDMWVKAIHDDKLEWTHVSDLEGWKNAVAKKYDVNSIPQNFLIDKEGMIIAKNLRAEELDKKLDEILK